MTVRRRTRAYDSWGRHCGARKRQPAYEGETCRRPAGWGTWHPGVGRCKLHGGARGYKHGRYSRVAREHMLPAVQRQLADYSIRTLLTILRARIHDDDRLWGLMELVLNETGLMDFVWLDDEPSTTTEPPPSGATRKV